MAILCHFSFICLWRLCFTPAFFVSSCFLLHYSCLARDQIAEQKEVTCLSILWYRHLSSFLYFLIPFSLSLTGAILDRKMPSCYFGVSKVCSIILDCWFCFHFICFLCIHPGEKSSADDMQCIQLLKELVGPSSVL